MRMIIRLLLVSCLLLPASCFFGPNKGPRVIGYSKGRVYLKRDAFYRVGTLPDGWRRMRTGAKAIAFHNDAAGATISTDAFCGAAHEDLPLPNLMAQLFSGLQADGVARRLHLSLDGRGALREISLRRVDGVSLQFDAVVLKKNNCTFDFVCTVPPGNYRSVVTAFEAFFEGFSY